MRGVDGEIPLPESVNDQESSSSRTFERTTDLAAGGGRLDRVSEEGLGKMPQRVRVDRAGRC